VFVVVELPLIDARRLLPRETTRKLLKPSWPSPNRGEFVRAMGGVRPRSRGGSRNWGDRIYCNAERALLFEPPGGRQHISSGTVAFLCEFRRYFSDGDASARLEVGFTCRFSKDVKMPLEDRDVEDVIRGVLATEVAVNVGRRAIAPLSDAGPLLARFVQRSTTKSSPAVQSDSWWVQSGDPILLVEYSMRQVASHPGRRRLEAPDLAEAGIDVSLARISTKEWLFRAWLLGIGPDTDWVKLRDLRMNLLRVHLEREAMRVILPLIRDGRVDPGSPAARGFLNATTARMKRPERYGRIQEDILAAAYELDELMNADEWQVVKDLLEAASPGLGEDVTLATDVAPSPLVTVMPA